MGQAERRLEVVVRGRVQGVGYRMFAFDAAHELGLVGWVVNESDGSVRVVAEGSEVSLRLLLTRLRDGPAAARVDGISEAWSIASGGLSGFSVRSGWHGGD